MTNKENYRFDPIFGTYFYSDQQLERILEKFVPLVTCPENYGFFKGILFIKGQTMFSCDFNSLLENILNASKQEGKEK